ncbi:MAG TPA: hypothetical protein ENH33_06265 [Actinobacteria bacterium]|nr:hypothetical protein [Actinomycetota bacterium]
MFVAGSNCRERVNPGHCSVPGVGASAHEDSADAMWQMVLSVSRATRLDVRLVEVGVVERYGFSPIGFGGGFAIALMEVERKYEFGI